MKQPQREFELRSALSHAISRTKFPTSNLSNLCFRLPERPRLDDKCLARQDYFNIEDSHPLASDNYRLPATSG